MSLGNTSLHQRGEIPEIVKLPNGRIRVIRRFHKFTREDLDNANLGSTMGDFGDLDTTGEQVANQGYADCRLISVEVDTRFNAVSNADNAVLVKTYETLTSSFVQITDDTVTFTENGLKQVTRVYRAVSGTDSTNVVGTTNFDSDGTTVYLASSKLDDNDAFAELTETYIEAGTLSRTEDFVGSQDSLVIEAIGPDPSTPSGFSLASKQESNFEGFQTNRFTFLRNNVQLSQTEDKVGSQLAISQQWFNPDADKTLADYSLASKNRSNFGGIETVEYRFLKDNVELSRSEDLVGSQLSITTQVFNPTSDPTITGYSLARTEESDVDGIPTKRFTFLKDDVLLSQGEDEVGSQNAITEQWFKPAASRKIKADYSLARTEASDVQGIPTERYTFLKPSILSVQQEFNETRDRITVRAFSKTSAEVDTALNEVTANHKLIAESEDDFEGIKTSTYVYELDSHDIISTEENGLRTVTRSLILAAGTDYDKVVGTDTITHKIDPTDATVTLYLAGFSIRDTSEFRVITEEYIEAGILSIDTNQDSVTDEVIVRVFAMSESQVRESSTEITANHSIKSKSVINVDGFETIAYAFEVRSTTTATELGDPQIGVKFETGLQTNGSNNFVITRQYAISSANVKSSILQITNPTSVDPVFDGTGGTEKAYIVDQEVEPNGQDGAILTRTYAQIPTSIIEFSEMVVRFVGIERGPFQLSEDFPFRTSPYSESVPVEICRDFFLSDPRRICRPKEFRPVDKDGNRTTVLAQDTLPTADEYIGFVNSGVYLVDRVEIKRWQGDIWERRVIRFKAE